MGTHACSALPDPRYAGFPFLPPTAEHRQHVQGIPEALGSLHLSETQPICIYSMTTSGKSGCVQPRHNFQAWKKGVLRNLRHFLSLLKTCHDQIVCPAKEALKMEHMAGKHQIWRTLRTSRRHFRTCSFSCVTHRVTLVNKYPILIFH